MSLMTPSLRSSAMASRRRPENSKLFPKTFHIQTFGPAWLSACVAGSSLIFQWKQTRADLNQPYGGGRWEKLSLAVIAKLNRLKYRRLRFVWPEPTIGRCTQPANSQLILQSSMKYLGLASLAQLSVVSCLNFPTKTPVSGKVKELPSYPVQNSPSGSFLS